MMDAPHPWDSTYQYQCKKKMFEKHRAKLGDERAVSLANVWANYHFLGCDYPKDALDAVKSWGPPPRDKMYEDKMKELKQREAVTSGLDKPPVKKRRET